MPIHTVAPDNVEYVRVIKQIGGGSTGYGVVSAGCVGRVISRGRGSGRVQPEITIVDIVGYGERVFNTGNLEIISEKEYFVGALGGRNIFPTDES